jgi:hypothetical protein
MKAWYFLAAACLSALICVYCLRQNNLNMIRLRSAVFTADKQNGDVEGALKELRQYVYAHMNTNLDSGSSVYPPIQLKYTYERLVQAEKDRVNAANSQIYTQAQIVCQQQIPQGFSGRGRVPCVDDYVLTHGTKEQPIPVSLYQFDFVSPSWSPDLAGWSLVTTIILCIFFCGRYAIERLTRHELSKQV